MATPRSGRWELLGHGGDPVPGSSQDVRAVAEHYRGRAEELGSVRDTLSALSELTGWTGEAAETFAVHAADGAEDIGKAAGRYDDAADALETYADKVSTARDDSWSALTKAVEADGRVQQHGGGGLDGVVDPTEAQLSAEQERVRLLGLAQADLQAARGELEAALSELEDRAGDCADALRDAEFGDGWFDDFKGFVREHADIIKTVVEILKWVAAVVGVVILVLALTIGAPFALLLLAAGLAALALALDGALLSVGEATWGDIAWDVAGLALSVAGLGAFAQLRNVVSPTVAAATSRALQGVATNAAATTPRLVRALQSARVPGLSRFPGVDRLLRLDSIRSVGDSLADARVDRLVSTATRSVETARPSVLARLRHLDGDLATQVSKIDAIRRLGIDEVTPLLDDVASSIATLRNVSVANGLAGLDSAISRLGAPSVGSTVSDGVDAALDEIGVLSWRMQRLG